MQQRRPRLGDILDDYCPRERRITNHAVVAMIEDEIKQTRCTTCDADHPYKQAKSPAPRRKKPEGALFTEGVDNARPRVLATGAAVPHDEDAPESASEPFVAAPAALADDTPIDAPDDDAIAEEDAGDEERTGEDEWPVHRPLIRATLPRPEGQVPERKEPDFTMRRPATGRGGVDGNRNGHRPRAHRPMRQAQGPGGHAGGQQTRFGGQQRSGGGHGQGQGQRHGSGQGGQQGNRAGRPGGGQGQSRGPQSGGGQGRKRGR
jgi:hypothetical protein